MATQAYEPIASFTASGGETEITISSIPGTFRDLVLTISGTSSAATGFEGKINGSASNMGTIYMYGEGNGSIAGSAAATSLVGVGQPAGSIATVEFFDYSSTNLHKTWILRGARLGVIAVSYANVWESTAAITSIGMVLQAGSLNAGTIINLYGIVG